MDGMWKLIALCLLAVLVWRLFASLFGSAGSRTAQIAQHNSKLVELKAALSSSNGLFSVPSPAPRKAPVFTKPPALHQCLPVAIREMELGAVHKNRVLLGTLVTDALKVKSVQSVLQDEAGDAVAVHIYNIPGLDQPHITLAGLEAAQALFPKGQRLAVIEPFYKRMLDGTCGVRVDNPAEVLFLDELVWPGSYKHVRSAADRRSGATQQGSTASSSGRGPRPNSSRN